MSCSPLLERDLDAPIAWLTRRVADYEPGSDLSPSVSGHQFLRQARRLAARLPEHTPLLLQIDNRYLFLLTLAAAALRNCTCLLPQSRAPQVIDGLRQQYEGVVNVHDGGTQTPRGINVGALELFTAQDAVVSLAGLPGALAGYAAGAG